jgi:hypothetical protein
MISPVMAWEHSWHGRLGQHAMPLIVAVFVFTGAVIVPALAVLACGLLNRHSADNTRRFVSTLAPLGFAMWAAHLFYHLAGSWGIAPIEPIQILVLDAGLLLTLYLIWRVARQSAPGRGRAAWLLTPWAVLASGLYGAGVWILLQPMQMRGMMMH